MVPTPNRVFVAVIFALALLSGSPRSDAQAQSFGIQSQKAASRRIVRFKPGTSQGAIKIALRFLDIKVIAYLPSISAVVIEVNAGARAAGADMGLSMMAAKKDQILSVEDDIYINWLENVDTRTFSFDNPRISASEILDNFDSVIPEITPPGIFEIERIVTSDHLPWGIHRVQAPKAWDSATGKGVEVCVIDTGISKHPNLPNITEGVNLAEEGKSAEDDNGHGTHVAGIIGAYLPNGVEKGIFGVAPHVVMHPVKVLGGDGSGSLSAIIRGIDWCITRKVGVINMSLGGPVASPAMHEAVKRAVAAGITVVAAAGNSGKAVGYPGAYPETIAVAASDEDNNVASFSSRGEEVDVIAPGVKILSVDSNGGHRELSGTSMACPHVAGLVALRLEHSPGSSPESIRTALMSSASPIGPIAEVPKEHQGSGMIDGSLLVGMSPSWSFASVDSAFAD